MVCLPHWVHWDEDSTDKQTETRTPGKKRKIFFKYMRPVLKFGTWNIHTMTPGFAVDLEDICDARNAAVINNELLRGYHRILSHDTKCTRAHQSLLKRYV